MIDRSRSGDSRMPSNSDRDATFHEAVAGYLDRLNGGEKLDPLEIITDHPHMADEILGDLQLYLNIENQDWKDSNSAPLGTLGDYTLRRQIGRGGMGVVYEAWENSMDRAVALKVLPAGIAADSRATTRFLREAQTAGKLSHPNIVPVFFTGVKEQTPFYAMEYVEGETLAQILEKIKDAEPETETQFGPKDQGDYFIRLGRAFADVADGLQHAHSKGVTHRDVKPSNLILDTGGRLRILDFGLARLEGQESLTLSGDFVGTPLYMSPEQAQRARIAIDHRTDIYSLGATIYESICGQPPFRGKDHADTLSQIIERDPVEPMKVNPQAPKDLETIALKCLRKDPGDRYGTAEALAQDLRRFARGDPIEAQAQPLWERTAKRLWKQRRLALVIGALLIFALLGSLAANVLISKARDRARRDLYSSNMRLAAEDWRSGNLRRFSEFLDAHVPESGEIDPRGWEYYYLEHLRHQRPRTLGERDPDRGESVVAWGGEFLAVGSRDGTVNIWNVAAGTTVRTLKLGSAVEKLAWSAGDDWLAASGRNGVVKIWEVRSGDLIHALEGHESTASGLAMSSDGRWLASGDWQGKVIVRNASTGKILETLHTAEFGPVKWELLVTLSFSPNSKWLAAGTRDRDSHRGPIVVWNTTTWKPLRLPGHTAYTGSLSWSPPDGRWLASSSADHDIRIWDTSTWKLSRRLVGHVGIVLDVKWSPDGSWLASGGEDGMIKIWNAQTLEEHHALRGDQAHGIAWSPSGELLAASSRDGTTKIWNPFEEQDATVLPARGHATWSPDGEWLAAFEDGEEHTRTRIADRHRLTLFEASTGNRGLSVPVPIASGRLAFSHDGRLIARLDVEGRLNTHRTLDGAKVFGAEAHEAGLSVSWSSTGRLATAGWSEAKIWEPSELDEPLRILDGATNVVAWSPEGDRLATDSDGGPIIWEDIEKEKPRRSRLESSTDSSILSMAWSPWGDQLACGTEGGELLVFNVLNGEEIHRTQGHVSNLWGLAWSPDGRRLVSGGRDHRVKIWGVTIDRGLEELLALHGHKGPVFRVAWHSDGKRLLSGGDDSVRIWNAPDYTTAGSDER